MLQLNKVANLDIQFQLLSVDGRMARNLVLEAGQTELTIPLADTAPGVYWLISKDHLTRIALKLVVIR